MARRIDLPAVKGSLDRLTDLAKRHPELTAGAERWSNHLDELDRLTMPAKTLKERQRSYRDRLRAAGHRSITVWLDAGTMAEIERRLQERAGIRNDGIAAVIREAIQASGTSANVVEATRNLPSAEPIPAAREQKLPSILFDTSTATKPARIKALVAEARRLQADGLTQEDVARRWNEAGIPTLRWQARGWTWKNISNLTTRHGKE